MKLSRKNHAQALLLLGIVTLASCGGNKHPARSSSTPFTPGSDDNGGGATDSSFVPYQGEGDVIEIDAPHHVDGTIHEFHSQVSSSLFCKVGEAAYYKVVSDSSDLGSSVAASFFASRVENACQVTLERGTTSDTTYREDAPCIYFGCQDALTASGIEAPEQKIGDSGYWIRSKGKATFVEANSEDGYNLATLHLLETLLGYDCLRNQTYVYGKVTSGAELPFYDFDVVEVPDFEARLAPGWADASLRYAEGLTEVPYPSITNSEYTPVHNTYTMMHEYQAEHPDWFDYASATDPGTSNQVYQLCYTAHGDEESFKEMTEAAATEIIKILDQYPDKHAITFTQMDTQQYCDCEACHASLVKYGTTSAVQIKFLNAVDDIVQAYIHDETRSNVKQIPTDFNYTIYMFAYHDTMNAPAVKDASGSWAPIDGSVRLHKNLGVIIAPSYALYTHSFYEEENATTRDQIRGWAACASKIYGWTYSTNFRGYTYPYNSFDAMVENARFWKENGAAVLYDSCSWESPILPGFMELKKYLNSKLLVNVNIDPVYYTKKWFHDCYGDAWETMYRLYRYERAYCHSSESWYTGTINDYSAFTKPENWPTGLMLKWEGLCNQAMEEISSSAETDAYASYQEAINLESIMPRFAMLDLHSDYYSSDELTARRKAFKEDCESLGITYTKEHAEGSVDNLWAAWGI